MNAKQLDKFIAELEPTIRTMPHTRAVVVNRKLTDLVNKHKGHPAQIYIGKAIQAVRKHHANLPRNPIREYKDHRLTDHAFVRGLERIFGVNIDAVKNRMIAAIEASDLEIVEMGGSIVTVLPKSATPEARGG